MPSEPLVQFALAAPLEEAVKRELLEPGEGTALAVNVRQRRRGAIDRRQGSVVLSNAVIDGSVMNTGYTMGRADRTSLVLAGENAYSFHVSSQNWRKHPSPAVATMDRVASFALAAKLLTYDIAVGSTHICVVGIQTVEYIAFSEYQVVAFVLDRTSYLPVRTDVLWAATIAIGTGVSQYDHVRCLAVGGGTTFVAISGKKGVAIRARILATTSINAGWLATTNLATDLANHGDNTRCYLEAETDGTTFAVVYGNNSGGANSITAKKFNAVLTNTATLTINSSAPPTCIGAHLGLTSGNLWVAWCLGGVNTVTLTAINYTSFVLSRTAASQSTQAAGDFFTILIHEGGTDTGRALVHGTESPAGVTNSHFTEEHLFNASSNTVVWGGTPLFSYQNVVPVTKSFAVDNRIYFGAMPIAGSVSTNGVFQRGADNSYNTERVLLLTSVPKSNSVNSQVVLPPAAQFPYGIVDDGMHVAQQPMAHTPQLSAGVHLVGYNVRRAASHGLQGTCSFELCKLDFTSHRYALVEQAALTHISSAMPAAFDGEYIFEQNFTHKPPAPALENINGTQDEGTYYYAVTYEWVDARGNVHRSAVSDVTNATINTATGIKLWFSPYVVTMRPAKDNSGAPDAAAPVIGLYKGTTATNLFRVGTIPAAYQHQNSLVVSDASSTVFPIAGKPQLYTTPGVQGRTLNRSPISGIVHICEYNGMLVVLDADGRTVRWSAQTVDGEGLWWSPAFVQLLPGGGKAKAVAAMDGSLYAFREFDIFVTTGEPPSDNGFAGGLQPFQRVVSEVGCINFRSVISTSVGIFFQSARGIELLNRSRQVEWVGESIQDSLAALPTIMSAAYDPIEDTVLFACCEGEFGGLAAGDGNLLVYDISLRRWVSKDKLGTIGGLTNVSPQALLTANGLRTDGTYRLAWLDTSGQYYEFVSEEGQDGQTADVIREYETPWVKVGGPHGEQRIEAISVLVQRSGTSGDHENLRLQTFWDYADMPVDDHVETWQAMDSKDSNDFYPGRPTTHSNPLKMNPFWIKMPLKRQTGTAVKLRLSDMGTVDANSPTTSGLSWIAVAFWGERVSGGRRMAGA